LPPTLAIEEVDCRGAVSAAELSLIARHCPKLRSLVLVYGHGRRDEDHNLGHGHHARGRGEDEAHPGRGHDGSHLAPLASLQGLQSLQVLSAEFYSHSLFTVVTQSGSRLTSLELSGVDEMNLAAVVMIGVNCPNLQHLAIACCHYTQEVGDRLRLENICTEEAKAAPRAPFRRLKSATFLLTSPIHLPMIKYPVFFADALQELQINQVYQPLGDSFLAALVSWNPLKHLRRFHLTSGHQLSLLAANILIQACPRLEQLSGLASWGRVEKEELEMMQMEVKARNLNLTLQ